ncbi:carboxypeptidase-like regulatory domain-containing protein [Draconibacterium sp. IB214405]|uniref:carboxypeptidase-like regulatory domain-containing protein n=1 Tax=Draconibacterium sp. IB214405 TaxID=3097352 RepID=UPI002A158C50|nr:carboxypeptidase-like regulatory domain-containing protein [Draconibacterium sp. IB214405]MDX8338298.1 carboxypeptidase-like regulatory domain-containing protein [Draconibacterium sp. IB214405]
MRLGIKLIFLFFLLLPFELLSQQLLQTTFVKKHAATDPGKVCNLPFFIQNKSEQNIEIQPDYSFPEGWKLVTPPSSIQLKPSEKQFLILSMQVPAAYAVGDYQVFARFLDENGSLLQRDSAIVHVQEIEKVSVQKIEIPDYVYAGEEIRATYILQNLGNTTKSYFIEAQNCQVDDSEEVKIEAGESKVITVVKPTAEDYTSSVREYFSIRVKSGNKVLENVNNWSQIFPSKNVKKDLYFRFPVTFSGSYLSVDKNDQFESTYQFQLYGHGALDVDGKHQLEFMARGPNNTDLSYLGLYDQYYLSYQNQNLLLFGGQKNFMFTPLTESSRYGLGVESKVMLNNGLELGFLYVEPRFYEEIKNEMGGVLGYSFNPKNKAEIYYVSKQFEGLNERTQLFSFLSEFAPFEGTNIGLELSRGYFNDESDNAYRVNLSSRFSIFNVSGNYFNTGKNYPGYYNNSKFYSGNISARITEKLGVSLYGRRDFSNAQLDTFFVTAPITESYQSSIDYKLGEQSRVKLFLRQYERKDRLSYNKFHYKTRSANLRFSQKWSRFQYSVTGEAGKTTNFLLDPGENQQNSFRGMGDFSYNFNSRHYIRAFGSWSNINEFVSGKQQNLTAGMSLSSRITENFNANFYVQNAYDIDDYYRNRNLMQLNLNYKFLNNHNISLRSFYTIFKTELEQAEFTLSATYTYKFGIPLKQIIKAGVVSGVITNTDGEPIEGVWVRLLNNTAVTDKNGNYSFEMVQPGTHLLSIDESSFNLDELTNIPNPVEVAVFEDQISNVDVRVLKGALLKGRILLEEVKLKAAADENVNPGNIIIEIKSAFDEYRVTTANDGTFDFPLLKPGKYVVKIYANSVPKGYKLAEPEYEYSLSEGETKEIEITLPTKKNNIIFKPAGNSQLKTGLGLNLKAKKAEPVKVQPTEKAYYSIQLGAFSRKLPAGDSFFKDEQFYFEKQIDNLHKYYIGQFADLQVAQKEYNRLKSKFGKLFIVVIDGDKVYSVQQYEQIKQDE